MGEYLVLIQRDEDGSWVLEFNNSYGHVIDIDVTENQAASLKDFGYSSFGINERVASSDQLRGEQ